MLAGQPWPSAIGAISSVTAAPGSTTGTARDRRPPLNPVAASAAVAVSSSAVSTWVGLTTSGGGVSSSGGGPCQIRVSVRCGSTSAADQRGRDRGERQRGRQRRRGQRAGGRVDPPAPPLRVVRQPPQRAVEQYRPAPDRLGRRRWAARWPRGPARRARRAARRRPRRRPAARPVGMAASALMVAPPTTADAGPGQVLRHLPADRGHGGQAEAGRGQRGGQHHLRRVARTRRPAPPPRRAGPAARRRSPRRRSAPGAAASPRSRCRSTCGPAEHAGQRGHHHADQRDAAQRQRGGPRADQSGAGGVQRDHPGHGGPGQPGAGLLGGHRGHAVTRWRPLPPTSTGDHQGRSNAAGAPIVASTTATPDTSYRHGGGSRMPAATASSASATGACQVDAAGRRGRPAAQVAVPDRAGGGQHADARRAAPIQPASTPISGAADGEAEDRPAPPLLRHARGRRRRPPAPARRPPPAARPGRAPRRSGPAWRSGRW